ncbi:MAG: hypothetical protein K0V04_24330 [Deltaproteobacteria bacterium]|nr:hypothetical protein [Deltaproteobacteria bacterium]
MGSLTILMTLLGCGVVLAVAYVSVDESDPPTSGRGPGAHPAASTLGDSQP